MNKILLLAASLLAFIALPGFVAAGEGPFTPEEIRGKFRAMLFGLNKEYTAVAMEDRPEGCVTFEVRIQRDGMASWFRRKEGEFHNHSLLKKLEMAVINRMDLPKERLKEPQLALQKLCFSHEKGVTLPPGEDAPPPPPKKTEELMEDEHEGVSNRAWLESLMATEGQPVEETKRSPETQSLPQGTLTSP